MGLNNPQPQPLQTGISLRQKVDTPEFWGLDHDEKKYVMDGLDQDFAGLSDDEKSYVLTEFEKPPTLQQGAGNLLNAATGAAGNAVKALPQTLMEIPGQIGNAVKTQAESFVQAPFQARSPLLDAQVAATSKGMDSLIGLGQGIYNLPGDLQNAYMGRNMTRPTQVPNTTQIPGVQQAQQRNPVAGFIGEQAPYALPFMQATRARYLPSIVEGAGIGAAMEPQDPNRLQARIGGAVAGGAFPAALGAASRVMRGQPLQAPPQPQPVQRPMMQARNVNRALEQGQQINEVRQLRAAITKRQSEIGQAQSVTEQKTLQDRLNKFNQLYKQLDDVERSADPIVSKRAAAMKQQVQKEFQRVQAEKETKFPSKKPAKQVKTLKPEQLPTAIKLGVKAVKTGGAQRARFKQIVKGYSQQDQFKINKGIEDAFKSEKAKSQTEATRAAIRREAGKEKAKEIATERKSVEAEKIAAEKARIKAAEKVANAKPKADPERKKLEKAIEDAKNRVARREAKEAEVTRKKELDALKKDIVSRSSKVTEVKERAKAQGYEPAQSQEGMGKLLAQAKKKNTLALVEYEAQIVGERDSSTYRFKTDTVVSTPYTDNNGKLIYKVINENGQLTTRHINDPDAGSRTLSVTQTDEPALYKLNESGDVVEIQTGRVIEQVQGETMRKSSEIRADIEKIENFDRTLRKYKEKKARVGDIVKASRDLDDVSLEKQLNDKNPDVTKDISGEPC